MNLGRYVGSPYRFPAGCWDLVVRVYAEQLGIALPSYSAWLAEHSERHEYAAKIAEESDAWAEVPKGQERPGDVVLLRMHGIPSHVGVVAEPGRFLHAVPGTSACLERYRDAAWARRVVGFYRHRAAA